MKSIEVFNQADNLVRQSGTRNAEQIAKDLGIWIYYEESFTDLLGMYTFRWNHRLMFLNARLTGYLKRMVIAHELGHDQQHRDIAKAGQPLKEYSMFSIRDTTEYEANAFAAHILLENEDVYSLSKQGYDVMRMARYMGVDVNLMLIKLQEMNRIGYDIIIPLEYDSHFFRNIKENDTTESD